MRSMVEAIVLCPRTHRVGHRDEFGAVGRLLSAGSRQRSAGLTERCDRSCHERLVVLVRRERGRDAFTAAAGSIRLLAHRWWLGAPESGEGEAEVRAEV